MYIFGRAVVCVLLPVWGPLPLRSRFFYGFWHSFYGRRTVINIRYVGSVPQQPLFNPRTAINRLGRVVGPRRADYAYGVDAAPEARRARGRRRRRDNTLASPRRTVRAALGVGATVEKPVKWT